MNWREQAASSHYQTAVAIQQQLRTGHVDEASAGIEVLIEALARSEKRALRSQLVRLMAHVLKWQTQPDHRTRSWAASIRSARKEIKEIMEETPSLTEDVIKGMWESCLDTATDQAEADMDQPVTIPSLTWEEVFSTDYRFRP